MSFGCMKVATSLLNLESPPSNSTPRNRRTLVLLLVLLELATVSAAPCTQISREDSFSCIACELEGKISYCVIRMGMDHPVKLDYEQCVRQSQQEQHSSLCSSQKRILSINDTNSEKSSIDPKVIIIVFAVSPASICLCCIIARCIKQRLQTPVEEPPLPETVINLQLFNIDELWPYYLDSTRTCPICLDPKCSVVTKCGHLYHLQCLQAWIDKRFVCPLCVSNKINPIAVYCHKCNSSAELRVLHKISLRVSEGEEEIICKRCSSIKISCSQIQIKDSEMQ